MKVTPALLIILDGFGCRDAVEDNAIAQAHKPNWDRIWRDYPHTTIDASEGAVGLPQKQMGNSEVGHLNIGAGRVIYQEYTRINQAIKDGSFYHNKALESAICQARQKGGALHLLGLVSDGGVHAHLDHIKAMVEMAAQKGLTNVYIHAFLDGRDTPPQSAHAFLAELEAHCQRVGVGRIASLIGRYFAMDRDNRWSRTEKAYDLIARGNAAFTATSSLEALEQAYARGEKDEFVKATAIVPPNTSAVTLSPNDSVIYLNFRSDRARQLTRAFTDTNFTAFPRETSLLAVPFVTMTSYGDDFKLPMAFPPERIQNCFGAWLASLGLKQLRIAETEKYAHVTFFFNGGEEQPFPGEDRILVPSPNVPTYDMQPEMSAFEVTDRLVEAIGSGKYDAIVCNYANSDMVGHSGNLDAARRAIEALDKCLGRVVEATQRAGGDILITADHGNAEQMYDPLSGQRHTAHTLNPVPLVYVSQRPAQLTSGGVLADVVPTLLRIMGVPQPREMTGKPLIRFP